MTTVLGLVLAVLVAANVPLAFALLVTSCIVMVLLGNSLDMIPQMFVGGIQSFVLLAVPLFMLAGGLMNEAGVTDRLFRFTRALVGHIAGGLAHVNVVSNLIMAGMSGSAVADATGLGAVQIPAMQKQGYTAKFAAAITAASATIGPIFPPSIPMVIFGGMANVSVGKLFLGGAVPALFMAAFLMVAISILARRRDLPRDQKATWGEFGQSFRESATALVLPVIIMGGIIGGIFTPTEAAGVAAVYALILGLFIYRTLTVRMLPRLFAQTAMNTAVVMLIIAATSPLRWVIAAEQIPDAIFRLLSNVTSSPVVLLLILNVAFLVLGCVMETTAIIVLSTPILIPLIKAFHIDPVHFGVLFVLNLMIGLLTPPVGMCMFVVCAIAKISVEDYIKESIPFFIALLAVLGLITYVPALVTWLPNLLFSYF
jgi:tripartite ATP-independent transporter DctM subunit